MSTDPPALRREVGLGAAVLLGLGSIVGTGVFVSIGIAAGITGGSVILAVGLAGVLATCNGLNSAQLAASHPVSGGTYEYGYRYLTPALGFTAGWAFLLAKSASAATAALGFAGYVRSSFGVEDSVGLVPLGLGAVAGLTVVVLTGIRRSAAVNAAIVALTLGALAVFVFAGLPELSPDRFRPFYAPNGSGAASLLEATALMFVAYTGYGRIATLGEEVTEPRRTIPRAIVTTLVVSFVLYAAVAAVAVGAAGAAGFASLTDTTVAPLEEIARSFTFDAAAPIVAIGAVTAMLGVLLNLILGLSRVVLAMGRRGDAPAATARLDARGLTPLVAVLAVGAGIAALVAFGNVRTTWTFSAFTVLVYYAITNLAALRISAADRRFPRWVAVAGLSGCLFLAFWVPVAILLTGIGLLGLGLGWHVLGRRRFAPS